MAAVYGRRVRQSGVAPGTLCGDFLSGFDQMPYLSLMDPTGLAVGEDAALATGMILMLKDAEGNAIKTLIVAVKGDCSGDGRVTVTDFIQIKSHLLSRTTLTGPHAEAADVNGDGAVTLTDFIQVKAILLRAPLSAML